jgi:hypothetical protein
MTQSYHLYCNSCKSFSDGCYWVLTDEYELLFVCENCVTRLLGNTKAYKTLVNKYLDGSVIFTRSETK